MLICTKCGSLWCLKVVWEARFVSAKGQKLTCLPRGAAEWLDWKTDLTVSRNQASRWLCRGNLPVAVHIVDSGESLSRK